MKNKAVALIHFQPLEKYPPIMNFIAVLQEQVALKSVNIFTTYSPLPDGKQFQVNNDSYVISRYGNSNKSKIFNYLSFNLKSCFRLIKERPGIVIYYESISAFPALFYKLLFPAVKLMIHYHEYVSPLEYKNGMKLVRWLHILERKFYQKAAWISQTNEDRLRLFRENENLQNCRQLHVLPNYPPASWRKVFNKCEPACKKIVYVGALSIKTMYLREFADWVNDQNGEYHLDIYSNNIAPEAKDYLTSLSSSFVRLKGALVYDDLPQVLREYQIGVILYNGHIPNYIFNAPNKLFEYLAIGLDVWFPDIMVSCKPYISRDSLRPVITEIDFTKLDDFKPSGSISTESMKWRSNDYFAEMACSEQILQIKEWLN